MKKRWSSAALPWTVLQLSPASQDPLPQLWSDSVSMNCNATGAGQQDLSQQWVHT